MPNLFGIIRQQGSTLIYDIQMDKECDIPGESVPSSYDRAGALYWNAMEEDFTTMVVAMLERAKSKNIKDYHEWIALYMHGTSLTNEEMQYRQKLAKRMNEDG